MERPGLSLVKNLDQVSVEIQHSLTPHSWAGVGQTFWCKGSPVLWRDWALNSESNSLYSLQNVNNVAWSESFKQLLMKWIKVSSEIWLFQMFKGVLRPLEIVNHSDNTNAFLKISVNSIRLTKWKKNYLGNSGSNVHLLSNDAPQSQRVCQS